MLLGVRIPMSSKEQAGVEALLERQGLDAQAMRDKAISFTRNDPGEKGPVRVEIEGAAWLVDKAGKAKKA